MPLPFPPQTNDPKLTEYIRLLHTTIESLESRLNDNINRTTTLNDRLTTLEKTVEEEQKS